MAQFPSLVPSEAPITPGAWPVTATASLNGAESRIRHGSAQIGRRLRLTFTNITEASFLAVLAHYRGQRSGFDSFGFDTTTLAADLTPAGHAWLYAGPPQVVDEHADCFTVACEFRAEPRGLVVAMGKTWRGGASVLTPGATSGGVSYGASVAWVTTATTLRPGNGPDPYFSQVALLLHFDGTNGSTTIIDNSSHAFTITTAGDASITTTGPKYGSGCLALDGTGDYIQTPADSLFALRAGDFTIECWVYVNSGNSNNGLFTFGGTSSGLAVAIYSGNWRVAPEGSNGTTMGAVTTGAWQHLALCRSGSSLRFFIDGTQLGSTITDTTNYTDNQLKIGYYYSSSYAINAKVDDFRLTLAARYTAGFTPSAQAFPNA
jgi:hypothetical protein